MLFCFCFNDNGHTTQKVQGIDDSKDQNGQNTLHSELNKKKEIFYKNKNAKIKPKIQ